MPLNFVNGDDNTLYFPSVDKHFSGEQNQHIIIHAPEGFYSVNTYYGKSLSKINKLYIRNYDTKQYEELDINQYQLTNRELYVYKNRLYSANCRPVKDTISDVNNLKFVKLNNRENTNYITDGKCLLYGGFTNGYSFDNSDGDERVVFGGGRNFIKYDIDIQSLKALNKDILYDGKHIINKGTNGIEIIPIQNLGFDVKVFPN